MNKFKIIMNYNTVVPLLRDHPVVHTKVVFEEGWSFIRGRKQCKPKHVSSGIVVLLCEVVFDQGGLSRGGLLYLYLQCIRYFLGFLVLFLFCSHEYFFLSGLLHQRLPQYHKMH